jgi:hypothetical protein
VVLIAPTGHSSTMLQDEASLVLDWDTDILAKALEPCVSPPNGAGTGDSAIPSTPQLVSSSDADLSLHIPRQVSTGSAEIGPQRRTNLDAASGFLGIFRPSPPCEVLSGIRDVVQNANTVNTVNQVSPFDLPQRIFQSAYSAISTIASILSSVDNWTSDQAAVGVVWRNSSFYLTGI